ncbi:hypothetical protein IQ235_07450 [Oscillatoriales cyanobacterium LEGE 11467]|uniref:Uncharacterized protein n=1 Tax=Zarconia navalis LEGE 11467 TaxID=1828826 RepID=A0A928Z7K1_9CYAN|nr:hypothetical protein [Zarconia navalis]MBE9040615.1 hypothetical protein [Zarconia navalis LEGE 11467]
MSCLLGLDLAPISLTCWGFGVKTRSVRKTLAIVPASSQGKMQMVPTIDR